MGCATLEIKRNQKLLQLFEFVGRHRQLKREGNRIPYRQDIVQRSNRKQPLTICCSLTAAACYLVLASSRCPSPCLAWRPFPLSLAVVSCTFFGFGCTGADMPCPALLPAVLCCVADLTVRTSQSGHLQLARFAGISSTAVAFPLQSSLTCHANGMCTPMRMH